jgi:hypothetical protein
MIRFPEDAIAKMRRLRQVTRGRCPVDDLIDHWRAGQGWDYRDDGGEMGSRSQEQVDDWPPKFLRG